MMVQFPIGQITSRFKVFTQVLKDTHTTGNGVLSGGQSGWGIKLTTRLHLVPTLRMHGVIPLLPISLQGGYLDNFSFTLFERTS
jgi:hypothetical protein